MANLEGVLARIGVKHQHEGNDASSISGATKFPLERLQLICRQFTMKVPFEQLDPAQGIPVSLDLADIEKKILDGGRGGFCFEINGLMHGVLVACRGEENVKRCMARVILGGRVQGFTHVVNIVKMESGREFLCDVGFGNLSLPSPMPMDSIGPKDEIGAPILIYPDVFRLVKDGTKFGPPGSLRMQFFDAKDWHDKGREDKEASWKDMYCFNPEQPVFDIDLEVGNFFVSTCRENGNFFTNDRFAVLRTPHGRKILLGLKFSVENRSNVDDLIILFPEKAELLEEVILQSPGFEKCIEPIFREEIEISEADFTETLNEEFGIHLENAKFLPGVMKE